MATKKRKNIDVMENITRVDQLQKYMGKLIKVIYEKFWTSYVTNNNFIIGYMKVKPEVYKQGRALEIICFFETKRSYCSKSILYDDVGKYPIQIRMLTDIEIESMRKQRNAGTHDFHIWLDKITPIDPGFEDIDAKWPDDMENYTLEQYPYQLYPVPRCYVYPIPRNKQ